MPPACGGQSQLPVNPAATPAAAAAIAAVARRVLDSKFGACRISSGSVAMDTGTVWALRLRAVVSFDCPGQL